MRELASRSRFLIVAALCVVTCGDIAATVPYPGSLDPTHLVANIRAAVLQTSLAESMDMPELSDGRFRVRRVLQVKSAYRSPGYLVAELEDLSGHVIADFAITRHGVYLASGSRDREGGRPLDLEFVSARLRQIGYSPLSVEYEYFVNVVEGGISIMRPLVVATTDRGTFYVNSRGEAFVKEGSPLLQELEVDPSWVNGGLSQPMRFRKLRRW